MTFPSPDDSPPQGGADAPSLRELLDDHFAQDTPQDRGPVPAAHVVAVLVAHDGATWLRSCLNALAAQTRAPDQVAAVDTGSADDTAALLRLARAAGAIDELVEAPRVTGFGAAVALGCEALDDQPPPESTTLEQRPVPSWLWLLHDDCAPAPEALEELLRAAQLSPGAAVLGPKVLDWNDPRLLVEVGLTIDRAGHRLTGLEPRELDQGQADVARQVLAVGTAGALVRREVWDALGGLDPALPMFRDDVDFCWRVAAAGARTEVAPRAVIRHARAAATGRRPLDAVVGPPRRADRRHALWVLVANSGVVGLATLPLLLLSCLFRAAGDIATRRPHHARDELGAVWHVVTSLSSLLAASTSRSRSRVVSSREVRRLLAPRGMGLRLRLSQAGDLLAVGADEPGVRTLETGTGEDDLEASLGGDDGRRLARLVLRPAVLVPLGLLLVTLLAAHDLLGSGTLVGGRLLPAPTGVGELWRAWGSTWTSGPSGGSGTPAAPWTPYLALLSTVTAGRPSTAIALVVLGAVPMAGLVAWHATRGLVASRTVRSWAAVTWALAPVATGAVTQGRFDVCVAVVALPWLVSRGARLLVTDPAAGGWPPLWRLGLVLAVASAFYPPVWTSVVLLALPLVLFGPVPRHRAVRALSVLAGVPVLLALPWVGHQLSEPLDLLAGLGRSSGLATVLPAQVPRGIDLLLASPGGPGVPWPYLLVPLLLVAACVAGLQDRSRLALGCACLTLSLAGVGAAALASRLPVVLPDGTHGYPWPGMGTALALLGLLGASAVAGAGLRTRLARMRFGKRTVAATMLAIITALIPVSLAVAWLAAPSAVGELQRRTVALLPPDVQADAAAVGDPGQRVLVIQRDRRGVLVYDVGRLSGPRIGDEDLRIPTSSRRLLDSVVSDLGASRGSDAAEVLTTFDVRSVVVAGRGRSPLTEALDSQPSLSRRDTPYDISLWEVTLPVGPAEVLSPELATAALATVPSTRGTGRGPSRSLLAATPPQVLAAPTGTVRGLVPAGPVGRLVVLAQARDGGWHATLDGRDLPPVRAWGWAQAFRLPATGGQLLVTRAGGLHRALQIVAGLGLLIVLVLASPSTGSDSETLDEASEGQIDEVVMGDRS